MYKMQKAQTAATAKYWEPSPQKRSSKIHSNQHQSIVPGTIMLGTAAGGKDKKIWTQKC